MNWNKVFEFMVFDFWAYALTAVAGFVIGTFLLHWTAGMALSFAIILGMRSMTPAFCRLLGKTGGQA